jgi:hypothetical protein
MPGGRLLLRATRCLMATKIAEARLAVSVAATAAAYWIRKSRT